MEQNSKGHLFDYQFDIWLSSAELGSTEIILFWYTISNDRNCTTSTGNLYPTSLLVLRVFFPTAKAKSSPLFQIFSWSHRTNK